MFSDNVSEYSGDPISDDSNALSEAPHFCPEPVATYAEDIEGKPLVVLNLRQFDAPSNVYAAIDKDMKTLTVIPDPVMDNDAPQLTEIWWNPRQQ